MNANVSGKTPGQIAYEAFYQDFSEDEPWSPPAWAELPERDHHSWEVAAKTAAAAYGTLPGPVVTVIDDEPLHAQIGELRALAAEILDTPEVATYAPRVSYADWRQRAGLDG